ncbi:MAG: fused acetyl/propionyl-CoA carboxylase subunit alpha/methylmalonyl-CoA decarboxylase subunit alpha, partial [Actinomycetota bacterium]|nr:fused acetyl/propionyl-CoA carboxylase subunit alpha/methylmalonyl-CoA decarboxylase subunit alpha [Actinomycetota bacterium]
MFSRIAIVNRGEAAMRLIRAVRELNHEHGFGIQTIALHTEGERRAMFVREADEAVCIGSAVPPNPYLDHEELARALRVSRADAAWVGWGFVAEDSDFAALCAGMGVVFVGPPAEVMRRLGDKISAKLLASQAGLPVALPVAPWSGGPVDTPVDSDAAAEALRSFGDPTLFVERRMTGLRHVEVQLVADNYGQVWALGVRDCSVRRRNQKLIEESRSTTLDDEQAQILRTAAINLARAAGYRGAGTVEFLYRSNEKEFTFLEINTRLQVEHPVTEVTAGVDLVKLQLHVAAGGRLEGEPPVSGGHAIEARLNAEDPEAGFAPAPGTVELFSLPTGPGIRVDTGVCEGDIVPAEYDSMIAKVIASGRDRKEARARLRRALEDTTIVLRGGMTNKSFLLDLLDHPEFIAGNVDTGWLDGLLESGSFASPRYADVALASAAIEDYDAEEEVERRGFYVSASRGRPQAAHEVGRVFEFRHRRRTYRLDVAQVSPSSYRIKVDGCSFVVKVERFRGFESRLEIGARAFRAVSLLHGPERIVEVDGVSHRVSRDEGGLVRASTPALVVAVRVVAGDEIEAGAPVAVLESMKMETTMVASHAGRVRDVLVAANVHVDAGAPLVRITPRGGQAMDAPEGTRIRFDFVTPEEDSAARSRAHLAALRSLLMGFDVAPQEARALVDEFERAREELAPDDPELLSGELSLLKTFADMCELSHNLPADQQEEDERVHSPREHFRSYLRSLDCEREGLPERFRARLRGVLIHYGVSDLDRSPELEEAVYRVFLAHERAPSQLPAVLALLDRRLRHADELVDPLRERLRETLDRLIVATQLRYPVVGELARSVRFRLFDQPLIEQARERVFGDVRGQLGYLDEHPGAEDYADRIQSLVSSPQPLMGLLAERLAGSVVGPEPMLEVLARRYYKIRRLEEVSSFSADGQQFVTADYMLAGEPVRLIATLADMSELSAAASAVARLVSEVPDPTRVVVDFYLTWRDPPADLDVMVEELRGVIARGGLPPRVPQVAVAVSSLSSADIHHFTFRPTDEGLQEERVIRGLHPMMARRLQFERLANFEVTRLPSLDDVYLFRCVARANAADERLVALAEVRDLSPSRDASGCLLAIPELERVLGACLEGMRSFQAHRPPRKRLHSNRVFLYVSSPVELPLDDLLGVASTLAPLTAGLGLEEVLAHARIPRPPSNEIREMALCFSYQPATGVSLRVTEPPVEPLPALEAYDQKVLQSRLRGAVYPYELIPLLTRSGGQFTEYDLGEDGRLLPVERPCGENRAGIVVGVVSTITPGYPEGMVRVALFGDPTRALGSIAEPECRRIVAALDLAEEMCVPVEWIALSSGAKISMDSGTENMDWVSRVLRRLINFTQTGGEVNIVVAGINVGAQPYWNAEATMLMHTRGILVMTPDSAMVLTGKLSLNYSGGVSAEDNFGIGGYDRIMGPNGQGQYWARDLAAGFDILFAHYDHTYVASGQRFPRRARTADPFDRDVCEYPHSHVSGFRKVGDIFSNETNPDRKKPFDIRTVMRSAVDQDHEPLERWAGMANADTAVVFDAHLGGYPVTLLGIESRNLIRH